VAVSHENLSKPFFSKREPLKINDKFFYGLDNVPVTQPTASKQQRETNTNSRTLTLLQHGWVREQASSLQESHATYP